MSHSWKHKKDEEALDRYPLTKKFVKAKKKGKDREYTVDYSIDLGELLAAGHDIKGLSRGGSFADLEKRLSKKKL